MKQPKKDLTAEAVKDIIEVNFKPIAEAFHDIEITDICIDRYDKIILYKNGEQIETDLSFSSEEDLESALLMLSNTLEQNQFSPYHPIMDARMPDGSRVAALHKIASPDGTNATIRMHRPLKFTIDDYVSDGAMTEEIKDYLIKSIKNNKNIIIAGSTGSWKTTLTSILASHVPDDQRVLICEDTNEIVVIKKSCISLEAPIRNDPEMDVIELPDLINHTFRRRPDRIIVGEIRTAAAAAAVYRGLTSGHDGLLTTIHARTCNTAFGLIAGYAASYWPNVKYEVIEQALKDSLNIVIHMRKHDTNKQLRYIDELIEVHPNGFETIIEAH